MGGIRVTNWPKSEEQLPSIFLEEHQNTILNGLPFPEPEPQPVSVGDLFLFFPCAAAGVSNTLSSTLSGAQ